MRVAILSGENHGTNYFRGTLVKRAIDRWGAKQGVEAFHCGVFSMGFLETVDVFYLLRPSPEMAPPELIHRIKRLGKPVVMDFDDDLFNVPSWSMSSQTFDIKAVVDHFRYCYLCADLVVTTTEAAARRLREVAPQASIEIVPNAFDVEAKLLRPFPAARADDIPCVGWAGGSQHNEDLRALEPVFHACLKKGYGLTFIGDGPRGLRGLSPKHKIKWLPGNNNVEMYQQIMPLGGFDVGLAPVIDHPFNHSKSALKATEYSWLCGCPSVLSDLSPYDEVAEDGRRFFKVKGFDVDAWMTKIDAALAAHKEDGRRYVLPPRYNLANTFPRWVGAFARSYREVTGRDAPGYQEAEAREAPPVSLAAKV